MSQQIRASPTAIVFGAHSSSPKCMLVSPTPDELQLGISHWGRHMGHYQHLEGQIFTVHPDPSSPAPLMLSVWSPADLPLRLAMALFCAEREGAGRGPGLMESCWVGRQPQTARWWGTRWESPGHHRVPKGTSDSWVGWAGFLEEIGFEG